jgi:UDP-N-acetylmuramoylalanine--D-glutamate ligase
MDLRGRRVTIMGLGRHGGGVAAARYCAQSGAIVTVTDLADRDSLAESVESLSDVPIEKYTLGEHQENDFSHAEVVVVNPAVRPSDRNVELARQSGAEITSETELFLDACPASVIGVTGTVGKSTTAAMLTAIFKAAGRRAWLGGNIGHSLLGDLRSIQKDDVVVLEMSSFQLHWLNETACWPKAAVITNCMPNHLDWHGTWKEYAAAKKRLVSHLPAGEKAVLNSLDAEVRQWGTGDAITKNFSEAMAMIPPLRVPGEHNRINAACAAAMARQWGIDDQAIVSALASFTGLSHRLRLVAEIDGRSFFNDSKSTTPAATIAALESMERPTWLILGGADKKIDWREFVTAIAPRVKGIVVFGSVASTLGKHFQRSTKLVHETKTLAEAVGWCWQNSTGGEAILLSPACPSTDQYRDFVHRGEEFEQLISALQTRLK